MSAPLPGDALQVAVQGDRALIRVIGRGSFKNSPALKEFSISAIDGGCRRLILDMAQCIGMDSTFMGVLAGLAFRLGRPLDGRIILVNLNERTRGLLATLGLDEAVEAHLTGDMPADLQPLLAAPASALTDLPSGAPSQLTTAETMLEAHENLVELSAENLPKFKDVLMFLRDDIRKGGGAAPKPR